MAKKQSEKILTSLALEALQANFEAEMLWRVRACSLLDIAADLPPDKLDKIRQDMKEHAAKGLNL